ncbi:MAG TPA: hypothetical protein RMH99_31250, partial [Sandaracinaceae bacterium LLY-WYZ-13_1]|nr:hypothetical protein [Sandaracinaceae bacterium LLY-WYZ-13_1]
MGEMGEMGGGGLTSLVSVDSEPPGENCANGGQRVETGVDDDGDGVLAEAEVDSTTYLCEPMEGATSLVAVSTEAPGAECAEGGQRIDAGVDDDDDGTLDPEEVDSTTYVCDGADGARSLVDLAMELPGANCAHGGHRLDSGVDTDGSGTLEASEIDRTSYLCTGIEPRFLFLANWAGFNTEFDAFDVQAREWIPAANLPVESRGQLASTGTTVLMLGTDDVVYEYDPTADTWTDTGIAGPTPGLGSFAFFRHARGKLYACAASTTTMHVHDGSTWSSITLPHQCSIAGGVDPGAGEVYVKELATSTYSVIDVATDTVVRTLTDATAIGENTSSAAPLDGFFYLRNTTGNIFRFDGLTGERTDTGLNPGDSGRYAAMFADPGERVIYVHSETGFDIYEPGRGTLTALPTGPTQSTLGTITLTY